MKAPTVSVSAGKSSAKVSWSKVNNYRYEVQYATNSKFQGAKKVSVHDQKTSVTIKYLTSKRSITCGFVPVPRQKMITIRKHILHGRK